MPDISGDVHRTCCHFVFLGGLLDLGLHKLGGGGGGGEGCGVSPPLLHNNKKKFCN